MAGGSGTRLWPMSTAKLPKQLIPAINGQSLLEIAFERMEGLVDRDKRYICAGDMHKDLITESIDGFSSSQFIGEPTGRDTLNALAYSAAILNKIDSDAVMAVFTADHIIEPIGDFLRIVEQGYKLVEENPETLVTFGIKPQYAATGFGYLKLGNDFDFKSKIVDRFEEKPKKTVAEEYFKAGDKKYLWNSGMFVWKASTLLNCVKKYETENYNLISEIAESYQKPSFRKKLNDIYPKLKKISIDYAVMEPASQDSAITVAAIPMPLTWLDVGSWTAYCRVCKNDNNNNSINAGSTILSDCKDTLVASDEDNHLIAGIGLDNMIVVHTKKATLICPKEKNQDIKKLYDSIKEKYGDEYI